MEGFVKDYSHSVSRVSPLEFYLSAIIFWRGVVPSYGNSLDGEFGLEETQGPFKGMKEEDEVKAIRPPPKPPPVVLGRLSEEIYLFCFNLFLSHVCLMFSSLFVLFVYDCKTMVLSLDVGDI
ncbi:unnamed protein product [Cuscuta epithymum]|uniref:Uncharacterized protein n=1 Tax=Cuscuta epithymum TaxID=186058 RepID=A0AAV0GE49_9ASTE|nr:unnamed protein product [Cuscuta epithymum]